MSDLVQKLLDASNKSDGWDAWTLAPIAAEYIKELEERNKELTEHSEALIDFIRLVGSEGDAMQAVLLDKAREVIAKIKGEE